MRSVHLNPRFECWLSTGFLLGDLKNDFEFNQKPLPPLSLPERPHTDMIGDQ
jgi:hypothetical protein